MGINFFCNTCNNLCKLPDCMKGTTVRCPSCQSLITVPMESTDAPIEAASPQAPPLPKPMNNYQRPIGIQVQQAPVPPRQAPVPQAPVPQAPVPQAPQLQPQSADASLAPVDDPGDVLGFDDETQAAPKYKSKLRKPDYLVKKEREKPTPSPEPIQQQAPMGGGYIQQQVPRQQSEPQEQMYGSSYSAPGSYVQPKKKVVNAKPFWEDLPDFFAYPLRGNWICNLFLIPFGVAIVSIVNFFVFAMFLGRMGAILALFTIFGGIGYIAAYLLSIIRETVIGNDTPPGWTSFGESFGYIWRFYAVILIPAVPVILYVIHCLMNRRIPGNVEIQVAQIVFSIYFPMSLLILGVSEKLLIALNPVFIANAISKILGHYILVFLLFFSTSYIIAAFKKITVHMHWAIALILLITLYMYFQILGFRMLGLMYASNRKKLKWFEE